jgi:hypothetical protein
MLLHVIFNAEGADWRTAAVLRVPKAPAADGGRYNGKKRDGHLKVAATKKDRGINPRRQKHRQQKGKQKRKH